MLLLSVCRAVQHQASSGEPVVEQVCFVPGTVVEWSEQASCTMHWDDRPLKDLEVEPLCQCHCSQVQFLGPPFSLYLLSRPVLVGEGALPHPHLPACYCGAPTALFYAVLGSP